MAQIGEELAGGEHGRSAIYSVALELFEGPLDLLLHLVRRHELDILDIPISFVAEKYLEYLHLMRSLDLEIAGDYLVMAATLAWLKSRELLPPEPREGEQAGADDEEGEDPREALIRRLVEYERFKSAAAELDALPMAGRDVFARGADIDIPPMDPGLAPVTLFKLAEAYYRVLTRAKINKTHDVTIEAVTVAQRMQQLTLMLDERQEFEFEALFLARSWSSEAELRAMLVVTLMSVLELVKLGVARVQQVPDSEAIRVYRLVASEEARRILESYDEDASFGAPPEDGAAASTAPAAPTEAELDALEERALLAEALAGLSGPEDEGELVGAGELGALAEELDPAAAATPADLDLLPLADEADLGPEAIAAAAANSAGTPVPEDMSEDTPAADLDPAPRDDDEPAHDEPAAAAPDEAEPEPGTHRAPEASSEAQPHDAPEQATPTEPAPAILEPEAADEPTIAVTQTEPTPDAADEPGIAITQAEPTPDAPAADEPGIAITQAEPTPHAAADEPDIAITRAEPTSHAPAADEPAIAAPQAEPTPHAAADEPAIAAPQAEPTPHAAADEPDIAISQAEPTPRTPAMITIVPPGDDEETP